MKTLKDILFESVNDSEWWDGHIHLFNHKEPINKPKELTHVVGFMDLEYDKSNIDPIKSYDEYIKNHYNGSTILLATGITSEEIKEIFEKHKSVIKGFGELKCYDTYMGEDVPYKCISMVRDICRLSRDNGNLPIYLHWDVNDDKDIKKISKVLTDYPSVPIVLCHCGMTDTNKDFSCTNVADLQKKFTNLWVDVSYIAMQHFHNNIMQLFQYDLDRVILGSDLNNKIFSKNHTEDERSNILSMFRDVLLKSHINNKLNINKLFKIKDPK